MSKLRCFLYWAMVFLLLTTVVIPATAHEEAPSGQYYTLVDENNNIIHKTGIKVHKGDEYIAADNARYEVTEVVGYIAHCVYRGEERMPVVDFDEQQNAWIFSGQEIPAASSGQSTVAVYCTHSDESYVPSDGKESIPGEGGIYDVAEAFVKKLKQQGFDVKYSNSNHNPHDINAYDRSRKTATQLLKSNPTSIVDVHRDATPPEEYAAEVDGEKVTQVKLVVGKQNPNFKTNLEFAKKIKSVMDKKTPNLSNGIFIAKGDYNQDLSPRAILIEVGSHTNQKDEAIKGVEDFAEVFSASIGGSQAGREDAGLGTRVATSPEESSSAFTTILILLLVVAAAGIGFYYLNYGQKNKNR